MKRIFDLILLPLLTPLRLVFFYLAAPPLCLAIVLFFAIEPNAITLSDWSLTHNDIQRAKNIVSNTSSQTRKKINLSEKDLNIALSYLLNYYIHTTSQIKVNQDLLNFKLSLLLNKNYFGKYLNFSFSLRKQHGYPVINALSIGKIKIADEFAGLILESIIKYTPLKDYYILAAQHVRDIQISTRGLTISYITPDDISLINKLSLNNKSYQSVIFYQQQISNIVAKHDPKWRLSLADLLQPLFYRANQRSTLDNAISENRALLIAVSTYVNKREIQAYLPFDISPSTEKQYAVSIYRRNDMAQHFMISASLAASGAETIAYILGQEKELSDAKRGSGFSFIDLACDRAGLKFGKMAIESPEKAKELQQRMAKIEHYKAFMPEVRDLPEKMNNRTFKRQYQSIYSAKYQKMLQKIDQRIDDLSIYK